MRLFKKAFGKKLNSVKALITDTEERQKMQYKILCLLLGAISAIMTIVNVTTYSIFGDIELFRLAVITGVFSIITFSTILVLYRVNKKYATKITEIILAIAIVFLFAYFIFTGGTSDGFSIAWILIVPTAGMLIFGLRDGTIISATVFLLMIIDFIMVFNLDLSKYTFLFEWNKTQMTRYPMLYAASYVISLFFEIVRSVTQNELVNLKFKYEELYKKDALTGLFNRHGFNDAIEKLAQDGKNNVIGFQIFDIDYFKSVNDTYGHINGDVALKTVADVFQNNLDVNATIYRWGGEEFAVLYYDAYSALITAKKVHKKIMEGTVDFDDKHIKITGSSGLIICETADNVVDFSKLINSADEKLYQAKKNGRNRLIFLNLIENIEEEIVFGDAVKN